MRRETRGFSPSLNEEDEEQLCIAADRQQPWPRRAAGDGSPAANSGNEQPATTDRRRRVCERVRGQAS
jgi:hypothetical protein